MPLSTYGSASAATTHGAIVPIQKITLSSNGGFTFTNIPQTYQDLFVVGLMRGLYASNFDVVLLQWGYTQTYNYSALRGQGSSVDRYNGTGAYGLYCNSMPAASTNSNAYGAFEAYIPNYAQNVTRKTALVKQSYDTNNLGGITYTIGSRNITDAITTLEIGGGNNAITAGSSAILYGIRSVKQ